MPQDALIQFVTTGAPGGDAYCFTTFPRLFLDMAASLSGFLPGTYSTFVVSQSEPVVTDRDKVWIQLDANNLPTGRFFIYLGGWFMRHLRRDAGGFYMYERIWWVGTESNAWSLDGGSGQNPSITPPTQTTGAMWERDTDFDFRFPLAAGTSPKPTTVSIGDTGGAEEHVLTTAELPSAAKPVVSVDLGVADGNLPNPGGGLLTVGSGDHSLDVTWGGLNTAHNNLPPYKVGIWLKPTIRQYFSP